jgi:hypothetical protein
VSRGTSKSGEGEKPGSNTFLSGTARGEEKTNYKDDKHFNV